MRVDFFHFDSLCYGTSDDSDFKVSNGILWTRHVRILLPIAAPSQVVANTEITVVQGTTPKELTLTIP